MKISVRLLGMLLAVIAPASIAGAGCDVSSSEPGGGACCPVDETPGCCMNYGGARNGGACGQTCDGMPVPNDPGWKLETDETGCPVWRHLHDPASGGTRDSETKYCGGPIPMPDASDDGGE